MAGVLTLARPAASAAIRAPGRLVTPLVSQRRTAIGHGGPGFMWKKTLLADRFRREGPVKRRLQQLDRGKKMSLGEDGEVHEVEGRAREVEREKSRKMGKWPIIHDAQALCQLFRRHRPSDLSEIYLTSVVASGKLAKRLGVRGQTVVIIGCGAGLLARSVMDMGAAKVIGIEQDSKWTPLYNSLVGASNGRFAFEITDALKCDFEAILRKHTTPETLSASPWEDSSEVTVLVTLSFSSSLPFWARLLTELSLRTGLFAFGRASVGIVDSRTIVSRMVAKPTTPEYQAVSVQAQAFFTPQIDYEMPAVHFAGRTAASTAFMFALLEPRADVVGLDAGDVFRASSELTKHLVKLSTKYARKQPKDSAGFPILTNEQDSQPQSTPLFQLLAGLHREGFARKVLDASHLDGALRLQHLSPHEMDVLLREYMAQAKAMGVWETADQEAAQAGAGDGGRKMGGMRSLQTIDRRETSHHGIGWDPLLDSFLMKQESAARW
eukprot:Rhum_TRINITY_DN2629_c0_g1::Rhum_TRINITY_DN2629_c0_g1_i1::g.7666::m.7666/K15266/TFB1M; dimethyladenosine transferase 1, mitochondrial